MIPPPVPTAPLIVAATVPFREAFRFWWKLGWISFGGPAGQIATMHEELVEKRRWISNRRFFHALDDCMVLPGPEAQQLATYIGWLLHGTKGGVAAGVLFVLPAAVLLTLLSWVYVSFGHVPAIDGVLAGFRPAVVAVIVAAVLRIGRRAIHSRFALAMAAGAFLGLELHVPFPIVIAVAAIAGAFGARVGVPGAAGRATSGHATTVGEGARSFVLDDDTPTPRHARVSAEGVLRVVFACLALFAAALLPLILIEDMPRSLGDLALFFTGAAFVTFGGAYAVLPHVAHFAVETRGWLRAPEMLDGLALGETTPGPLILVVTFVGYLAAARTIGPAAGVAGAAVATWFTFLPSFLFVLAGGPFVEEARGRSWFSAPFAAVSAAVVGVIAHLARDLAPAVFVGDTGRVIFSAVLFTLAETCLLTRWLSVPWVVLFAGLAGLLTTWNTW